MNRIRQAGSPTSSGFRHSCQRLWGILLLTTFSIIPFAFSIAQEVMIQFEDDTLRNGLRVILHRDTSTPIVCINICYHVGSKDEVRGKTGFAHLFEHLMFDGSANVRRAEFDRYCERAGGYNNAYTTEDKTNYYMVLPSNQLELGLWLESDRLLKLHLTEEGLKTQREVVKEEKRQSVDNRPYGIAETKISAHAFSVHPYSHPVIGSMEDIGSASMEDVINFHETYYRPNNAILVIAGDIDIAGTKELVNRYFGSIPQGGSIPRVDITEPERRGQIRETIPDDVQLPGVFIAYNICAEKNPDYYALDLLSDILSTGTSSRLYHSLVYEQQIASSIAAYVDAREHPGLFFITGITAQGTSPDVLEHAISEEIHKLQRETVGERELEKAKNKVESALIRSLQTIESKADRLAHYTTFYGEPAMINTAMRQYEKVIAADVQRAAVRYLRDENSVVLHFLPKEKN